jgi:hypothetical protein
LAGLLRFSERLREVERPTIKEETACPWPAAEAGGGARCQGNAHNQPGTGD